MKMRWYMTAKPLTIVEAAKIIRALRDRVRQLEQKEMHDEMEKAAPQARESD